eukprot:scaffold1147_cov126-Cylindrotheca_fusiformis.AAC.2
MSDGHSKFCSFVSSRSTKNLMTIWIRKGSHSTKGWEISGQCCGSLREYSQTYPIQWLGAVNGESVRSDWLHFDEKLA